jgi:hypothetical protein
LSRTKANLEEKEMMASRNRGALPTVWIVLIFALVIILCFAVSRSFGEEKKPYQAGTIVDVKVHQSAPDTDAGTKKFDVSVKVGNKIYVVLYSPPGGQDFAEYGVGMARTVLVEGDLMKLNDLLGRTRVLPVLSVKDVPPKSAN